MIRFATAAALCSFALLAACSAAPADPVETSASQIGTCEEIDEHQVEHACLHSFAGPFRSVTASIATPPDVSREHTAYRITLPLAPIGVAVNEVGSEGRTDANGEHGHEHEGHGHGGHAQGASGAADAGSTTATTPAPDADAGAGAATPVFAYRGAVSFLPEEDGEYAFYTSSSVAQITATDAHGKTLAFECATDVPEDVCSGFKKLRVVDLEHGEPVTLQFSAPEAGVLLLVEHVGDGHGHGHSH